MINFDSFLEWLGMALTLASVWCFSQGLNPLGLSLGAIGGVIWLWFGLRNTSLGSPFLFLQAMLILVNVNGLAT